MKRLIYILVAFTALLTAACSQTIVFDEINEVVPPVLTTIQDNQIWYTTTNGKGVSTIMSGVVSNTYENGKGIITFDRPIDVITVDAFYNCAELKSVQLPQTVMAIEETAFGQCTSLSSIKLSNELRNIGPQAFSGCTALVSITIPDSVEQIEQRTFCDCTALKSVTFGATSRDASSSNLRIIGQCAFQNCTSLVNITLPSKLEIIAEDAFTNCTSLISITIPQSVNHVENNVFIGCSSLKEFNGKFATSDSRSLVRDRELIAFAPASLTEYTIDSDVVAIVGHVFSGCNRLQTVNIPSSVESVDEFSFWECSALKSVTLPENVRFIGGSAFWQCTSLASVYCKSITPPELGNDGVFDDNKSGRKIYVPTIAVEEYKRAQHWSEYASAIEADKSEPIATDWAVIGSNCSWDFATATPMTISGNYAIANGVTFDRDGEFKFAANGGWDISYGLDSSVLITAGKTYQGVLSGENIKIAAGTYNIKFSIYDATFMVERVEISTNHLIFYASTDGNVVTPYAADVFGANIVSNTYAGDQGIITFDGDITKIGNSAFKQCNTLQAIIIPQSVTKIDHFAFTDCTNLTAINFPSGVTEIGNLAFNNCQSLESVVLPNSLTKIGTQAFYCCNSISSVTIPQSVTTISDNAFGFCASLAEFKGKFASEDGRCLVVNGTLNSFASAGVTEYTIPSSVTAIGHYAMHNSALLTTVTIPQSVQTVGDGAFNGCISLASVYCKPTTPPTGGSAMFDNNAANRKIYVPAASVEAYKAADGWKEYADAIFADADPANCQILYTSTDGNVVTPYKTDAFGANIVSNTYENGQGVITFDGEVTTIGPNAFWTRINLTSITIPDSVTSIGYYAFQGCGNLTSITIPDSVTTIEANPFLDCRGLVEFDGKYASADRRCLVVDGAIVSFAIGSGVTEYTMPQDVTKIEVSSFAGCTTLTTVTIPSGVTVVRGAAFSGCSNLVSVYCKPTTPPTGEDYMFNNNAADRKIYVPAASVEAYKAATGWSTYADAIVAEDGDATIGGFDMVFVEGGTFTMGATSEQGSDYNSDECPTHSVTVSDFYIGRYEVTQTQWETVMGWNKSGYTGDKMSVEKVSWNDVQEFIAKLNAKTGKTFRLPTEAEWEYAARGGNKSNGYKYSGSNNLEDVAWYYDNSNKTHHPVGQKQQNELGIYDMSGNLWEWCQDWYGSYSSEAQTNPKGPSSGSHRILRGGCWDSAANNNRISVRSKAGQDFSNYLIGFRLACNSK